MPFRTIDLCAGIGGIRKGFEMTGDYVNVLSAEVDKYACLTYEHLYGENPNNDLTSEKFKNTVENTQYDVLLAGFPCQTFSRAGNEEGFNDEEKGIIFNHIAEIIERTRPRAIFLENVDNLVRHDKGNTFKIIIKKLEVDLNYKVIGVDYDISGYPIVEGNEKRFVRNSKYFGVPQNRPRTYIVAFDRERYDVNILNTLPDLPQRNDLHLYEDLRDLIELQAEARFYMSSGYFDTLVKHKEREKNKGNGFGYRIVNAEDIEHPIANTIMATGGSGKERNLVYDPQEGIAGTVISTKTTPLNEYGIRVMTPREWGKLQGFINYAFINNGIDEFSFPEGISDCQKYKQFGNSVTIPVIETMARYLTACFVQLGEDINHI